MINYDKIDIKENLEKNKTMNYKNIEKPNINESYNSIKEIEKINSLIG